MVEVSKPDYLSLVNQNGSGFNISELVTSIVASEIEPKRSLQNTKLEKTESAISGIGFLNAQSTKTQSNFSTISADNFYEISSSNASAVEVKATDETKLTSITRNISDVTIAKRMVFELPGFSSSDTFTETLSIDFGTWSQASTASSSTISHPSLLEEGKTYKILRADGNGDSFDQHTRDPHDPSSTAQYMFPTDGASTPKLSMGSYFRAGAAISDANYDFQEVDNYAFTQKSGTSTVTINAGNDTLSLQQMVSLLDAVDGIDANLVQKSEGSTQYSVVISSENTGLDNGFKIKSSLTGDDAQRWQTSLFDGADTAHNNTLTQAAQNAEFKLDGVSVTRSDNVVSDIIDGAQINLNMDLVGSAVVSFERSEGAIRQTLNDTIFSLNEFKTEIDRLTFIDVEGDENGPLAMDTAATRIKSNFKKLPVEPLVGHGSDPIYLSQLGIKTNSSGEFYLDETTFEKTLSNNPDFFSALKDINLSSDSQFATVTKSQYTTIPSGTYTVSKDGDQWKFGDTNLTQIDLDSGGSRFTSVTYPGLVIETIDRNPANFQVFSGNSFAQKIIDSMTDILALNSPLVSAEDTYKNLSVDIEERLEKLEEREKLITSRYTEQFGAMEQSMSQFNSTKTMLENFIEAWKKQK